jgi:hypothetical protein
MDLMADYAQVKYLYDNESTDAAISIGAGKEFEIQVDPLFFKKITQEDHHWKKILPTTPIYTDDNGRKCFLETIFYLVNCIQEINPQKTDLDHWGRYKYTASLQHHYGIIEQNYVATLMDTLIEKYPSLAAGKGKPINASRAILSHDIDLLLTGWKVEAYLSWTRRDWKTLAKVVKDFALGKPFYNNIDQIIELDKKYGFTSIFYWLPMRGKDANGIMNADYGTDKLVKVCAKTEASGCVNGIHKSSFPTTFSEEMSKFPSEVAHNRYHFLKFETHKAWKEIESAGLKTDASLGFAEHIGFRNSYGLPFVPYDMENDRSYTFLEIPLHVMDVTLSQYLRLQPSAAIEKVESFIKNNSQNCILSFLWHNNVMNSYENKASQATYEKLLTYLSSKKIPDFTAESLLKNIGNA